MNGNASKGSAGGKGSGCSFGQHMVNQTPVFHRRVLSRKNKVYRPDKRAKKPKFL